MKPIIVAGKMSSNVKKLGLVLLLRELIKSANISREKLRYY